MGNKLKLKVLVSFFFSVNSTILNCQNTYCPPNIDFELGKYSYWRYETGTCCPVFMYADNRSVDRHFLTNSHDTDFYGGFPIVAPGGGQYSLKLGNDLTGSEAEQVSYYLRIPANINNYSLVYRYAVVFEDPSHSIEEQPRFEVKVFDSATNSPLPCNNFTYIASSNIPGFKRSNNISSSTVYYKPWSAGSIDLTGLGGKTIIVKFSTGDCAQGGHFGYGYVDLSCSLFKITSSICPGKVNQKLIAPPGYKNYLWYDSTLTKFIDSGEIITIKNPALNTKVKVILIPYLGYGCQDTLETSFIIGANSSKIVFDTMCSKSTKYRYTKSGIYYDTFINSLGCDSFRTLNLFVKPEYNLFINKIICRGDSFMGYKTDGIYNYSGKTKLGCDSSITYKISVKDTQRVSLFKTICRGDTYHGYTKDGIYNVKLKTAEGCDSTLHLNLTVSDSIKILVDTLICEGTSFNGYTTSGKFYSKHKTIYGCDSIYNLNLKVKTTLRTKRDSLFCNSIIHRNKKYTENLIYFDTISYNKYCDSLITEYHMIVKTSDTLPSDTIRVCGQYIYEQTYCFNDTILHIGKKRSNYLSCDSIFQQRFVYILPFPMPKIDVYPDTFIKFNSLVNLIASGGSFYLWNNGFGTNNSIEYLMTEKKFFEVRITADNGCDTMIGVWVKIIPEIEWAEVFSPNGDGNFDVFAPKIKGEIQFLNFKIFNRWGQIVFESSGEFPKWDGSFRGIEQPQGTYIYQINYYMKKDLVSKIGAVTLIR